MKSILNDFRSCNNFTVHFYGICRGGGSNQCFKFLMILTGGGGTVFGLGKQTVNGFLKMKSFGPILFSDICFPGSTSTGYW